MKISQHMTAPAITITSTTSIPQARQLLQERHFRHLPVVDQTGLLLGMVTDRDLRSAYPSSLLEPAEDQLRREQLERTPVVDIMSPATFTLAAAATLDDALLLLDREGVGALPVVDEEGRVVGIFSIRDLISAYRQLFGLGEWGSAMLALQDDGQPRPLSRLCAALEQADIHFHRLLRATGPHGEKIIYLRVNTYNLPAVRKSLAAAGFSAFHDQ
ncbi:MAG: CBS domain-containing protein [Desulfurivibrio sp.]|nr:CBS domain-containing protein [Desulfurivibrio sp.]